MQITQQYARPSSGAMLPDGMRLDVSTECSRPPVHLEALVKDSLAYARLMLALYDVVTGDLRNRPKDHSAYQKWVEQRYLGWCEVVWIMFPLPPQAAVFHDPPEQFPATRLFE